MSFQTLIYILLAMLFVLLNGFFVAAEFSMVKIRHTRVETLKEVKGLRGRILAKVDHQLDAYLSACQLGITLSSLGLGWIGEPAFAVVLKPLFIFVGIASEQTISFLAFFFAFGLISYLHIVIGELMPKSLAIRQTERISLLTAVPLYMFYWLMFPAIWILNVSSNVFLKWFKLDKIHKDTLLYTHEEINRILRISHEYGEFSRSELNLLTRSLHFADLEVSDVMRPINELVTLDVSDPVLFNKIIITQKQYSRYPVYNQNPNNIIGVIHIKDLFFNEPTLTIENINKIIRPILNVQDDDSLSDVFDMFRKGISHLAIVLDDKKPVGFMTLDNLLQGMVGVIKDEFHFTAKDWVAMDDGSYLIKGSASIYSLETVVGKEILAEEVNTVSGLILEKLQGFPAVDEKIAFDGFDLVIRKIKGSHILQVQVYKK